MVFLSGRKKELWMRSFILSQEGVTQGDTIAMAKYALATRNLIRQLKDEVENVRQVWFADDSNAGGDLVGLKEWWDLLKRIGPSYGYYPKPGKTCLVLKDPEMRQRAEELFGGEGMQITVERKRQIGAVIVNEAFKRNYVCEKIEKWVLDVNQLAEFAKEEPLKFQVRGKVNLNSAP